MKQESEGCQNGSSQITKVGMEVGQKNKLSYSGKFSWIYSNHQQTHQREWANSEDPFAVVLTTGELIVHKSQKFSTVCWVIFPGPRPASRRLQYGKAGEGLVHFLKITLFTGTVVLDSSVGMRQACPGEMVTYTCTVTQGAFLDWIVEPFLPTTAPIQFTSIAATDSSWNCNNVATVSCSVFNFVATLTNTANPTVVMTTTLADMTSTLTFTAAARLNGTVVQCRGTTENGLPITNNTLNVAGAFMLQHLFHK